MSAQPDECHTSATNDQNDHVKRANNEMDPFYKAHQGDQRIPLPESTIQSREPTKTPRKKNCPILTAKEQKKRENLVNKQAL